MKFKVSIILLLLSFLSQAKDDYKTTTLIFEHKQSKDKNYEGVKESLQSSIKSSKYAIKVDNPKKGKIIANFNAGCEAGMFGMSIDVHYIFTANFKKNKTRMILETDKLTVASNDVAYSKDNSNEAKYTKCRQDLLNSIKEYSLKPSNDDDNW